MYSAGAGVVQKVKWSHRRARFSIMAMYVDAIRAFAWIQRYAAPLSVFLIRMLFGEHLICIATIMWSIVRKQNL